MLRTKLVNIYCPFCGKEFRQRSKESVYCSQRCQWDAKKLPPITVAVISKTCSKCKLEKMTASSFSKSPSSRDGLSSWCKDCIHVKRKNQVTSHECKECMTIIQRNQNSTLKNGMLCIKCHTRKRLEKTGGRPHNYTGNDFFTGSSFAGWKSSAKRRGRLWSVTKKELAEKYIQQNGICALSGITMENFSKSKYRPSIDRIDSSKDYSIDNVQFVCSIVNVMKNKFPESIFIDMCEKIFRHASTK